MRAGAPQKKCLSCLLLLSIGTWDDQYHPFIHSLIRLSWEIELVFIRRLLPSELFSDRVSNPQISKLRRVVPRDNYKGNVSQMKLRSVTESPQPTIFFSKESKILFRSVAYSTQMHKKEEATEKKPFGAEAFWEIYDLTANWLTGCVA